MTYETLFPFCIGGGVGVAVMLFVWWGGNVVNAVPPEDRTYRDRPPRAFRVLWWPIQWLAYYLGPRLPMGWRQSMLNRLRLAGLDYALSPEQFIAARLLFVILAVGFICMADRASSLGGTATLMVGAALAYFVPAVWLRDRILVRKQQVLKMLPFILDLVCLCVEGGLSLTGALQQAIAKGPPGVLRDELTRVLRDIRAGKSRAEALRAFSDRMNEAAVRNLVTALIQADAIGMSLGPILRGQAEQRRSERFARAEKAAMEAPVRMLLPLIAFIFPCTFIVLGFPIAMKFLQLGL